MDLYLSNMEYIQKNVTKSGENNKTHSAAIDNIL